MATTDDRRVSITAVTSATLTALTTEELMRIMSYTLARGGNARRHDGMPSMYELAVELATRVRRRPNEQVIDVVAELLALLADHLDETR